MADTGEPSNEQIREHNVKLVYEIDRQSNYLVQSARNLVEAIAPQIETTYGNLGTECVDQLRKQVDDATEIVKTATLVYKNAFNNSESTLEAELEFAKTHRDALCAYLKFKFTLQDDETGDRELTLFSLCEDPLFTPQQQTVNAFMKTLQVLQSLETTEDADSSSATLESPDDQPNTTGNVVNYFDNSIATTSRGDDFQLSPASGSNQLVPRRSSVANGSVQSISRSQSPKWVGSFSRTKPAGVWFGSETTPRLVSAAERQSGPEIARAAVAVSGLVSVICSPEDAAKFSTRGELVFVNPGRNVPFDTTTPAQYASANDVATPLVAQQSHQELVVMGAGMAGPGTVADPAGSPKDPAPWGIPEGAPVVFAPVPLEPAGDGMLPPMAVRGAYHPGDPAGSGATPFAVLGLESAASSRLSHAMLRRVTLGTYCGKNERGSGILVDLGVCVV